MPGRSRLFSETEMSTSSTSSLFKHITETMPLPKRRRGNDLNTRFDQMIQTMNVSHRSPPRRSRNRTRSNGSSSVSSYDYMPKTPLDAYDGLDAGSLGREFSVIKMKPSAYTDDEQDPDTPTTKLSPTPATKALPSWLATTFQGLNRDHPLRLLMPLSRRTSQQATSSDSGEEDCPPDLSDDEQPFAYLLPPPNGVTHRDPSPIVVAPAVDVAFVPFAKPGPASTLSPTWPAPILPRIIQDVLPVPVPQQPKIIFSPPAPISFSYHDAPIQEPHNISPSYAHSLPPYTLASPYHAPTSPAAMPPPSSDIPVARYSDDPPLVHTIIPNIYATPGPGYLASRPAYFDSPTEPPEMSSSPVPFEDWAPNADFDPTELDFHWKPFDRTKRDVETPYDSAVEVSLADMDVYAPSENDYVFEEEEEMMDVDVSEYAADAFASPGPGVLVESSVAVPDDSLFQFDPPSPSLPPSSPSAQSKEEEHVPSSPPKPTSTPAPAPFMPAPGIYISPLRQPSPTVSVVANEENPLTLLEKLDKVAEAPVISIKTEENNTDEEKDELFSDSDTDTIESWD